MTNATEGMAQAVVERLFQATNDHDVEGIVACFAPDYHCEMPLHPGRSFTGSDQVRRNWIQILGGVPNLTATVTSTATDGDSIWVEQEHAGTRRDGQPHLMRGVIRFHVADGLIDATRFYLEPVIEGGGGLDAVIAAEVAGERAP
jgi:ketosteroid isomerase-like protein